jgi:multiple sugar transport system permease protein
MMVTVKAAVIGLPLGLALSLGLAMLLNQRLKAIAFWRTVYFLPSVLSGAAVAVLWVWLLNPEFGVLDLILRHIGLPAPDWLGDTATALPSLIVVSLWGIGGSIVIYLAGLQGIPTELYEAAEVDGANAWQRFLHVTLPMLSPVIFFNLIIGLIGQFQWFTEPYVMTQGGPENSTLTFMLYLYQNAFTYFKMGYASAMAWVFFALVLVLTVLVFRSSPMWVHYEGERRR